MVITIENERFCPGVITDKVHLPSPTIAFSVPVIIYVKESGAGVEFGGSDFLLHGRIIGGSGAHAETVEVEIHDGFCSTTRSHG